MQYLKPMDKMVKARIALILDQRFFGSLAYRLKLVEDTTAETCWTDGVSLGFNPDFVDKLTMDELKGLICHEVMHPAMGHHVRRQGRDPEDWNIACDYAVDPIILSAGMVLPGGGRVEPIFKDKSADDIFTTINGRKKQDKGGKDGSGEGSGKEPPADTGQGEGEGHSKGKGKGDAKQGSGKGDPGGNGEVRDFPGKDEGQSVSEDQLKQQEQEWKIAVGQAANQAKSCGQLPGGLEAIISEMLETKVNWKEALQRFVEQVSRNDYTWQRPNPRYAGSGIILPSLHNKELPPIDVWIDTSGSVSEEEKKQFAGEINDIRGHYKTTIRVIYCDTSVRHHEIIEPEDNFTQLQCRGGGGTRFSPAIKWSMDQDEQPCCGIYLTDMECYDFGPEPEFPVLWVQTKGRKASAPFGELIQMEQPF